MSHTMRRMVSVTVSPMRSSVCRFTARVIVTANASLCKSSSMNGSVLDWRKRARIKLVEFVQTGVFKAM